MIKKILSLDPSSSNFGWAYSQYDTKNGNFKNVKYGSFKSSKIAIKNKEEVAKYGLKMITLDVIEDEITKLITQYNPDYVVSEDAFMHQYAQTYASLVLIIYTIQKVCRKFGKVLYTISPKEIKVTVASSGNANKEAVQNSVINHEKITVPRTKSNPIDEMSEHEADAIATGYAFAICILPTLNG